MDKMNPSRTIISVFIMTLFILGFLTPLAYANGDPSIIRARWDKANVKENTGVLIIVDFKNVPDGTQCTFEIWEDDGGWKSAPPGGQNGDDYVSTFNAEVKNNKVKAPWTATWSWDLINPEYYFIVRVLGASKASENLLKVFLNLGVESIEPKVQYTVAGQSVGVSSKIKFEDPPYPDPDGVGGSFKAKLTRSDPPEGWTATFDGENTEDYIDLFETGYTEFTLTVTPPSDAEAGEQAEITVNAELYVEDGEEPAVGGKSSYRPLEEWDTTDNSIDITVIVKEYGCCKYNGECCNVRSASECEDLDGTLYAEYECCGEGANANKKCYAPKEEKGCCEYGEYDGECKNLTDAAVCTVCYDGDWYKGMWCSKEDKCIPEFTTIAIPAVTTLLLLFLISRRKRKR